MLRFLPGPLRPCAWQWPGHQWLPLPPRRLNLKSAAAIRVIRAHIQVAGSHGLIVFVHSGVISRRFFSSSRFVVTKVLEFSEAVRDSMYPGGRALPSGHARRYSSCHWHEKMPRILLLLARILNLNEFVRFELPNTFPKS